MDKKVTKFDPTPEQKKAGLADVAYEMERLFVNMFELQNTLGSPQAVTPFECLLLHARVTLEFFQRDKRSWRWKGKERVEDKNILSLDYDKRSWRWKGKERVEDKNILSLDYEFPASKVHLDRSTWERLNSDLAHLSYGRTREPWNIGPLLLPLFERCLEFTVKVVSGPLRPLIDGDPVQVEKWSQLHKWLLQAKEFEAAGAVV